MRISSAIASPVVLGGVLASAALAQELPELLFTKPQSDCSFQGLDRFFPAPVAEGNGMLSAVERYEVFDGTPYHHSSLSVFSCVSNDARSGHWEKTETADAVLSELRAGPTDFAVWANRIDNSGATEVWNSALPNGQAECACLLHYGIEVSQ
ncbi:MAG: hypothetical protein GQ535_05640 [Rhodobacteraceae bacterium]|nr:hypothetical protein [Paracoccaceae bacterium]